MIINKNTSMGRKQLAIIITAALLALLIVAYVVITAVMSGLSSSEGGAAEPPEILEGEALYGNSAVAYPTFYESAIQEIIVKGHEGTFSMKRPEKADPFVFYYLDENGDTQVYYPDICGAESGFDYTELYAIDQADSMKTYKVSYLANALGYMYFGDRIHLSADEAQRNEQMKRYGLDQEHREIISVSYLDAEGKLQTHTIIIGDRLVSGVGYYFMVSGRDYVYTGVNNRFDYALGGFEGFLHTRLIATGLEMDGLYEPFMATDYKQWKNRVYSKSIDDGDGVFDRVLPDSVAVVSGKTITPIYDAEDNEDGASDGYLCTSKRSISFDLEEMEGRAEYERLVAALLNKPVGTLSDPLTVSVITDTLEIDFGESNSVTYTYHVTAVESVLTDGGEYTSDAAFAASGESAKMLKVTYDLTIGGEKKNAAPLHAILDLSDTTVPQSARTALLAEGIGASDVTFDVSYDKSTATSKAYTYVISEIALICEIDEKGMGDYLDKVTENSVVTYRYYYKVDGVRVGGEYSRTVDLSAITEGDELLIKEKLIGKSVGKIGDLSVLEDVIYCQAMMSFDTYEIESVNYFVTEELITSFEFVNASNRNPFYGESLYINTLPSGHDNYGYALNSTSCETAVKLLGGISGETSQYSEGLLGAETVAVGITPDNMAKYGLYAHTVYFELPRGIQIVEREEESDIDSVDDYTYLSTLGFTLYISEPDEDGFRFIGSDMYDIIVKIDGEAFAYLDNSFVDYWARRGLVMIGYENIDNMTVDLYMDDVYGSYELDMLHSTKWISGNRLHDEKPANGGQVYDFLTVNVSRLGDCSETAFSRYLDQLGMQRMSLAAVYNYANGAANGQMLTYGYDTLGTANFKDFLLIMFSTYFSDSLGEADKSLASEDNLLMRITFTVSKSSAYPYVYEFYRIDDRRVMVSITQTGGSGQTVMEADDFYISTFAFKKIVRNFQGLLDGKSLDGNVGYGD